MSFCTIKTGYSLALSANWDWIGCKEPYNPDYDVRTAEEQGDETSYGISRKVQQCLAAIRTDLDSFSETEAFALMTSGYLMTEQEFRAGKIKGFPEPEASPATEWEFLKIRKVMEAEKHEESPSMRRAKAELIRQLEAGASRGFKIWKLKRSLRYSALAAVILLVLLGFSLLFDLRAALSFKGLAVVVGLIIVGLIIRELTRQIVWLRDVVLRVIIGSVGTIGSLVAFFHLWTFDKWFTCNGRLESLLPIDSITHGKGLESPASENGASPSEPS